MDDVKPQSAMTSHDILLIFLTSDIWALIQYKDVVLPVKEIPLWR